MKYFACMHAKTKAVSQEATESTTTENKLSYTSALESNNGIQ